MKQRRREARGARSSRAQLRELNVRPSKQRGQNFVTDESVIDSIISFGRPLPSESLVEIGPGLGALTAALRLGERLSVIEIEEKFCLALRGRFPDVEVIQGDARQVDFSTLGSDLVVFGNIPYVYSTDMVFHLIESSRYLKRAVLLLQREFAERLSAAPGGRDYGTISVACRMWADACLGPIIPGNAFHPPTKVESRLVELRFLKEPRVAIKDPEWFRKVVKAAFLQRRKKLRNSLLASGRFSKDLIAHSLAAAGIDGNRRAETLSIEEFASLSSELAN